MGKRKRERLRDGGGNRERWRERASKRERDGIGTDGGEDVSRGKRAKSD